jgi:IS30 family transposase
MNNYKQLSLENRYQVRALLDAGLNQTKIAKTIGVHRSTISRELKRNVTNTGSTGNAYCPEAAQQLTDQLPLRQTQTPAVHRGPQGPGPSVADRRKAFSGAH